MTHTLDQLSADFPGVLWSGAARERINRLVERFPDAPGDRNIGPVRLGIVGLELRLAAEADQVDLTFPLLKEDRDALLALAADEVSGRWLREDRWWRRVLSLCRCWADSESLLGSVVQRLWLEIDVAPSVGQIESALPAPGIFVGFEPCATSALSSADWCQVFSLVIETLGGDPPPEALVKRFETLCAATKGAHRELEPSPVLQYLGLMLSRGSGAVRCVVAASPGRRFRPAQGASMAAMLGWPGDAPGLRQRLEELTTRADGTAVHDGASALQLDLTATEIMPRLGLELVLDRTIQRATGQVGEAPLLERLVAAGLCAPEKGAALRDLPIRHLGPWSEHGRVGHALEVHHLKLVVDSGPDRRRLGVGDDGLIEAKAYCGQSLVVERRHEVSVTARSAVKAETMGMEKGESGH